MEPVVNPVYNNVNSNQNNNNSMDNDFLSGDHFENNMSSSHVIVYLIIIVI